MMIIISMPFPPPAPPQIPASGGIPFGKIDTSYETLSITVISQIIFALLTGEEAGVGNIALLYIVKADDSRPV